MKNKLLLYFLIGIISIPTYSQNEEFVKEINYQDNYADEVAGTVYECKAKDLKPNEEFVKEINYQDNYADEVAGTVYECKAKDLKPNHNVINQQKGCISGDCENGFGVYKFHNGST